MKMITDTHHPRKIMTAHTLYMKAERELVVKNYLRALEYYERASHLFTTELGQSPPIPDKEIWEKELVLIDLKIKTLQTTITHPNLGSTSTSFHSSSYDELILGMRHIYPKTGTWSSNVVGLDSAKQLLDDLIIPLNREDIW
jgi:hypothetical protein